MPRTSRSRPAPSPRACPRSSRCSFTPTHPEGGTVHANVDQIADRIYRISTCIPDVAPGGFTFNQFLIDAEEPLLYHTGMRQLFPLVKEAIERVMPVERLRWISFAHVEADECGAVNEFLAVAPPAQAAGRRGGRRYRRRGAAPAPGRDPHAARPAQLVVAHVVRAGQRDAAHR